MKHEYSNEGIKTFDFCFGQLVVYGNKVLLQKSHLFPLQVVLLGCMLFFSSVFAQVAPGDEDVNCKKRNTPYDDNVIMLMDSRNYQDLLHDSGAVWDEQDYDDNNSDDLYNPTSVSIYLHYIQSELYKVY